MWGGITVTWVITHKRARHGIIENLILYLKLLLFELRIMKEIFVYFKQRGYMCVRARMCAILCAECIRSPTKSIASITFLITMGIILNCTRREQAGYGGELQSKTFAANKLLAAI
jgi:hypothetical protein